MVDRWTEVVLQSLQKRQSACKDGLEIAAFHCINNRSSSEKRICFKQWISCKCIRCVEEDSLKAS